MTKRLPLFIRARSCVKSFSFRWDLSAMAVARAVGVPRTRIERLAKERGAVTADTALRLARYFQTSPAFWMGIQAQYDLEHAEELGPNLMRIAPATDPPKSAA